MYINFAKSARSVIIYLLIFCGEWICKLEEAEIVNTFGTCKCFREVNYVKTASSTCDASTRVYVSIHLNWKFPFKQLCIPNVIIPDPFIAIAYQMLIKCFTTAIALNAQLIKFAYIPRFIKGLIPIHFGSEWSYFGEKGRKKAIHSFTSTFPFRYGRQLAWVPDKWENFTL